MYLEYLHSLMMEDFQKVLSVEVISRDWCARCRDYAFAAMDAVYALSRRQPTAEYCMQKAPSWS